MSNLNLESARKDALMWWSLHKLPQRESLKRDVVTKTIRQKFPFKWANREENSHKEHEKDILFVDIETNGLPINRTANITDSNNWPYIVQIAWLIYSPSGTLKGKKSYLIKPTNYKITSSSYQIHKISEAQAHNYGVECNVALSDFSSAIRNSSVVIGHNIEFDSKIIQAEMVRNGIKNDLLTVKHLCTMMKSRDYCNIENYYGLKNPTLEELYKKLFNKTFQALHNAEADVSATAECFWRLKALKVVSL